MEMEGLVSCSQQPTTRLHPESDESILYPLAYACASQMAPSI